MDFKTTEEYIAHYNGKVRSLRGPLTVRARIRHAADFCERLYAKVAITARQKAHESRIRLARLLVAASHRIEPKGVPGGDTGSRKAASMLRLAFSADGITDANFPAMSGR